MATPYIGEIKMVGFNFAPQGWAFCDGSLLAIDQFPALFNLIGTTYGGDGQQTFGVPDLRGRVPMHQGGGFEIGQLSGTESVTLITNQVPAHSHFLMASTDSAAGRLPGGAVLAQPQRNIYDQTVGGSLVASSLTPAFGGQPHDNLQPFLAVSYVIALAGIFPTS